MGPVVLIYHQRLALWAERTCKTRSSESIRKTFDVVPLHRVMWEIFMRFVLINRVKTPQTHLNLFRSQMAHRFLRPETDVIHPTSSQKTPPACGGFFLNESAISNQTSISPISKISNQPWSFRTTSSERAL